jgi:hypothetical protein
LLKQHDGDQGEEQIADVEMPFLFHGLFALEKASIRLGVSMQPGGGRCNRRRSPFSVRPGRNVRFPAAARKSAFAIYGFPRDPP